MLNVLTLIGRSIQWRLGLWNPGFRDMTWQNWVGMLMLLVPIVWGLGYFVLYALFTHTIVTLLVAYIAIAVIWAGWRA